MSSLARGLYLERTSVTRNLARLEALRAITVEIPADDKRRRFVTLTVRGEQLLADAFPRWLDVQRRLISAVGERTWNRSIEVANFLTILAAPNAGTARRTKLTKRDPTPSRPSAGPLTPDMIDTLRRQMCMCTTLRRCARAISSPYNQKLRPLRMKVSQLHVLAAIETYPETNLSKLVDVLTLDQSSLSRMVKRLQELDLVQSVTISAQRVLKLSKSGKATLRRGATGWRDVQSSFDHVSLSQGIVGCEAEESQVHRTAQLVCDFARSFALNKTEVRSPARR